MTGWELAVRAYAENLGLGSLPIVAGRAAIALGEGQGLRFERVGEFLLVQWQRRLYPGESGLSVRLLRLADRSGQAGSFPHPLHVAKKGQDLVLFCRLPIEETNANAIAATVNHLFTVSGA